MNAVRSRKLSSEAAYEAELLIRSLARDYPYGVPVVEAGAAVAKPIAGSKARKLHFAWGGDDATPPEIVLSAITKGLKMDPAHVSFVALNANYSEKSLDQLFGSEPWLAVIMGEIRREVSVLADFTFGEVATAGNGKVIVSHAPAAVASDQAAKREFWMHLKLVMENLAG